MGKESRYWCPVETWRLLGVLGIMFVMVITLQHFQLPSMTSVRIDHISENDSLGTLSKSETINNMMGIDSLNSSNAHEKDEAVNSGILTEENLVMKNASSIDTKVKESSLQQAVEPQLKSILDPESNKNSRPVPQEFAANISLESINNPSEPEASLGLNKSEINNRNNQSAVENAAQPNSTVSDVDISDDSFETEEVEQIFLEENTNLDNTGISDAGIVSTSMVLPPVNATLNVTFLKNVESNVTTPVANVDSNVSAVGTTILDNHGKLGLLQSNTISLPNNSSFPKNVPQLKKMPQKLTPEVISVADMNSLLLQSWSSMKSMNPRWASATDVELLRAKSQIENAPVLKDDPILRAPLYWNISTFRRSYELMEEKLKVYIYKEGEKPILHQPVLKGIYASEGWFMKNLEANKKFVTKRPSKAHLFYLPFSSRNLELQLYVPGSHTHKNLVEFLKNYLDIIVAKYSSWNRSQGADHFFVACHDWAPSETRVLMSNCIRALCNADVKEGFVFGKDVSLPETNVRVPQNPLRGLGGKPPSQRSTLAFFAGSMHGYLRPILLKHWGNKDPDMKIFNRLPKSRGKMNYLQYMKSSKYCICPRGYEVNSPRIVEALMLECVPVIISDNYVPPFYEVLNWESFAVFVAEKDIPYLKNILVSIPEKRYREMYMRVKKVQQHFLWHAKPVKYDLFHMILHSVWYNRVFQMQPT